MKNLPFGKRKLLKLNFFIFTGTIEFTGVSGELKTG